MLKKKSNYSKISIYLLAYIYTCVLCAHMYEYMYADIQSIWIFQVLQASRPDPWAHIRVHHVLNIVLIDCKQKRFSSTMMTL